MIINVAKVNLQVIKQNVLILKRCQLQLMQHVINTNHVLHQENSMQVLVNLKIKELV